MLSKSVIGRGLNMEEFSYMSKRVPEKETAARSYGEFDVPAYPGSSFCPHFYNFGQPAAPAVA